MKYTAPSFSVPATGKAPADCKHGFLDNKGKCVFCGEKVASKFGPAPDRAEVFERRIAQAIHNTNVRTGAALTQEYERVYREKFAAHFGVPCE